MNSVLQTIVAVNVTTSLIAAALLLLKPLIRRYCSKRWQYAVWLIVAIRLLVPIGVSIPVPMPSQHATADTAAISADEYIAENDGTIVSDIGVRHIYAANDTEATPTLSIWTLTPYEICLVAVFGIAIARIIGKVILYRKFKKLLMHGTKPVDDDIMLDQFDYAKEQLGIRRSIGLLTHDAIGSPMLIGMVNPAIIIPSALIRNADGLNLHYVFLHELTHYKRLDIIYKWLLQCVKCMHWFNPLVYIICRECEKLCELSSDEAVTAKLSHDEKRGYGDTLLRSVELTHAYAYPAVALTLAENTKLMKERLAEIMHMRKKGKFARAVSVTLSCLITVGALITGVYAAPIAPQQMNKETSSVKPEQVSDDIITIDIANTASSSGGMIFLNLGKRTLAKGQRILADIAWEGGGRLMFLYSKESYDAKSIMKLLGKDGLPNTDNKWLNFATSDNGSIKWFSTTLESGEHYFYMIAPKGENVKNIHGTITPNYNHAIGQTLPRMTNWSGSAGETEKNGAVEINVSDYTGDKINYEFTAKKGESKKLHLNSFLQGSYEIVFTSDDRTVLHTVPAFSGEKDVVISNLPEGNVYMRLLGFGVTGKLIIGKAATLPTQSAIPTLAPIKDSEAYVSRAESLAADFADFKPYGITFDKAKSEVYYYGERVKLFVSFQQHKKDYMGYAFDLCFMDNSADGALYMEAVRDSSGKITGVRQLDKEMALDILGVLDKDNKASDLSIPCLTMDATHIIESVNIVANDFTKDKASRDVIDWMKQCDKKVGGYVRSFKTQNGYDTYIYYNGGGRYPWTMVADKEAIRIKLYSDAGFTSDDGYHLMHFTSPKEYDDIEVYLDGKELVLAQSPKAMAKSNDIVCEGGIAANLTGPASAKRLTVDKGDEVTVSLIEDLSYLGSDDDKIKLTVMIGDQSVAISNTDREKTVTINKAGTYTIKVKNSNMQLVNYTFSVSTE